MKCFLLLAFAVAASGAASSEKLLYHPFDSVTICKPSGGVPGEVVLFVSGEGGWTPGAAEMAGQLADLGALVVGINSVSYLKHLNSRSEKCHYPAGEFELLSKFVQKSYALPRYITPMVIGISSGAALAYALVVQAPPGTFKGGISMAFRPDLPLIKPLCSGNGLQSVPGPAGKGFVFLPNANLSTPWMVLQGAKDEICTASEARKFAEKAGGAEVMELPLVGHGFTVEKDWLRQFQTAFKAVVDRHNASAPKAVSKEEIDVGGLPLVEVPASVAPRDQFAIILTGDGGWAGIDQSLAASLASKGISVVGWNSLQYYWTKRTPEEASKDLGRIIGHYRALWKKETVTLIGYSFGADALPFLVNRLDSTNRRSVDCLIYLGLSPSAEFHFHATGWLGGVSKDALPTLPEIHRIRDKPMLYFYGTEEKETVVNEIDRDLVRLIPMEGGHHFGGKYSVIADSVLSVMGRPGK